MSDVLGLFQGIGVEIEYMIVDEKTLAVRPIADALMEREAGVPASDIERDPIAWSNELVLHVLELKTNGPAAGLAGLAARFQDEVARANAHLAGLGARLLPTGAHPLMDPRRETKLWPHESNEVYRTFDRIFGARAHGWANLQSTHVNLPFANDDEFARLHAAVRALLPIMPALAASSPYREGAWAGCLDGRLDAYRTNAARIPSVSGLVVPEPVASREQYEREILGRIYDDLEPHDPDGVLRHEWVNARGAIARFSRGSIEIRVLDTQECPRADLAVVAAIVAAARWLVEDPPEAWRAAEALPTLELAAILDRTIRSGLATTIAHADYVALFGAKPQVTSARALWRHIIDHTLARMDASTEWSDALDLSIEQGCLARRIVHSVGPDAEPERMLTEYRRLSTCLAEGTMYQVEQTPARAG